MSELQLLEPEAELDIPADVAVCPYCNALLVATFRAWEQNDDGTWRASEITCDCVDEPDLEDDEDGWTAFIDRHSYMPYVYQLPVDTKVLKWVNARYRFNL